MVALAGHLRKLTTALSKKVRALKKLYADENKILENLLGNRQ